MIEQIILNDQQNSDQNSSQGEEDDSGERPYAHLLGRGFSYGVNIQEHPSGKIQIDVCDGKGIVTIFVNDKEKREFIKRLNDCKATV